MQIDLTQSWRPLLIALCGVILGVVLAVTAVVPQQVLIEDSLVGWSMITALLSMIVALIAVISALALSDLIGARAIVRDSTGEVRNLSPGHGGERDGETAVAGDEPTDRDHGGQEEILSDDLGPNRSTRNPTPRSQRRNAASTQQAPPADDSFSRISSRGAPEIAQGLGHGLSGPRVRVHGNAGAQGFPAQGEASGQAPLEGRREHAGHSEEEAFQEGAGIDPHRLIEAWHSYRDDGGGLFSAKGLERQLEDSGIDAEVIDGRDLGTGDAVLGVAAETLDGPIFLLPSFVRPVQSLNRWFDAHGSMQRTARVDQVLELAEMRWDGGAPRLIRRGRVA